MPELIRLPERQIFLLTWIPAFAGMTLHPPQL